MTKKFKSLLLVLLAAAAVACTAAGCSIGTPDLDEILEGYSGGHVTYYGNGGKFDGMSVGVREIYYKSDGVPFFYIQEKKSDSASSSTDETADSGNVTITYEGYDFGGWYEAARYTEGEHEGEIIYTYTDSEGNTDYVYVVDGEEDSEARPYYAREGKSEKISESSVTVVASETLVTKDRIISSGETLAVCAVWTPTLKIVYKLVLDDKAAIYKDANGNEYKDGDVLDSVSFGSKDTATPGKNSRLTLVGATFVRSYADEACTTEIGTVTRPEDGQDVVVWCKYIDGDGWTIVSATNNATKTVQSMFGNLSNGDKKYYIIDDIDCSNVTIYFKYSSETTLATIEGNGHKLYNINISATVDSTVEESFGALFGKFGATAVINDLTIDTVNITLTAKRQWNGAAISYGIAEGAKISGLTVSNVTMSISAPNSGEKFIDDTNWLFGQATTDEAFLKANPGITVSGVNTLSLT